MRVIIVIENPDEENIKLKLKELCESTSIIIISRIDSAREFINNQIIQYQQPLDLILIYSTVNGISCNDLLEFIRDDFTRTYSKRDFNIDKIPIALIVEEGLNKNLFNNYDVKINDPGIDRLNLIFKKLINVIKSWRKNVLKELDYLGIQFNSGFIDYTYYFANRNKAYIPTKILSQNFKSFPRRLNYYWIDFNREQIEKSIDDFIKMLKRSTMIGKKGEEKFTIVL